MSNWTSNVCVANNIVIHYTRTGGEKPPVILLHGLMTNGLCWTILARALEADYDVLAARNPGLLCKVVLADPPFLGEEMQRKVYESDVASQHKKMLERMLEEVIADARARHPQRSGETLELFARARLQTSMAAFGILTPPYPDYKEVMRSIDIPCLLVFGDKGVVTTAVAAEVQQPGIQVKQLRNASHSLHMDQPERFAELVKTFIGCPPDLPAR